MFDSSWHEYAAKTALILQFLVSVILLGVMFFGGIILTVTAGNPHGFPTVTILSLIVIILVIFGLIARSILFRFLNSKASREIIDGTYRPIIGISLTRNTLAAEPEGVARDARYLLTVYQVRTIFSAAMFEGWALFSLIAYLVEGNYFCLGLAALLTIFLVACFPTRDRIIRWVECELETLELHSLRATGFPQ